ncbi:Bbp19 family protein [Neoroseomonas eburnea]
MSEVVSRADRWAEAREAAERRRDDLCETYLACFSTPAGQRVLLDLEAFVHAQVLTPDRTEAELRDHMGQKRLLGIIIERIEHGRRKRAAAGSGDGGSGRRAAGAAGRPGRRRRGTAAG